MMLGWDPSFNWTHEEFNHAVSNAFNVEHKTSICLDVEHSDRRNMDDIIHWAEQAGYRAEEVNMDTIRVMKG